jgi:hypothetical protein
MKFHQGHASSGKKFQLFDIIIPIETLKVDSRRPLFVAGRAWIELDGADFPRANWSDSPLSVLGSLSAAISTVRQKEVGDFYFFDGPYFVKIFPITTGSAPLQVDVVAVCDRDSDNGVIEARAEVSLSEVVQKYALTLSSLRDWAARQEEAEVLDLLLRMPSFDTK